MPIINRDAPGFVKSIQPTKEQLHPTPKNVQQESPPGSLPVLPAETAKPAGDFANYQKAFSDALTEAAKATSENRIKDMSGLLQGGASYSVIQAAVGLAQQGLSKSRESIFSEAMSAYKEDQKLAETKKTSALNMINTIIDNGVFTTTPPGTLLAWEKEAGLPEGTALAWQARLKIKQDQSDEKGALELQLLRKEIADKTTPTGSSNFTDILQEYIDAGSTPEQAARKAASASEALGVPVSEKTLTALTKQARNMKKSPPVPVPPAPPVKTAKERGKAVRQSANVLGEALQPENLLEAAARPMKTIDSFFSGLFGD